MRSLSVYYSNKPGQLKTVEEIKQLCDELGLFFVDICVDNDPNLEQRFASEAPVVLVGAYRLNSPFTLSEIEVAIRATLHQEQIDSVEGNDTQRFVFSKREKFALWFSKNYAWVVSLVILVFMGSAFLPPIFASNGNNALANMGYKFYSLLCHQLAFRSYFILGEQYAYPRELAHVDSLLTYEDVTGKSATDIRYARDFFGDNNLGYKLALCERDIAIYAGLGLFGLFFQFSGKKLKHIPWYVWLLIAVVPIAIDGGSQLPALAEGWPAWMPIRESTPFLRTITGALFGIGTAWYVFPLMEENMKEPRFSLERKLNISKRFAAK
jgi:uncharacterized membrane protein